MAGRSAILSRAHLEISMTLENIDPGPFYCIPQAFSGEGMRGTGFILMMAGAIILYVKLHDRFSSKKRDERNFAHRNSGIYGTAGWMSPKEIKKMLGTAHAGKEKGIVFGERDGKLVYLPDSIRLATVHFQPGQRVLVKVLSIKREAGDRIQVAASVKQATEDPCEKALRRYTVGNRYVGTVTGVDTNGVFVSMDGGIDCLCTYPDRGRPPRGSRVTLRVLGINHETNRIWGRIIHMTTAR